ncbi:MAG: hypothetical protein MUC49_12090 [Raineya sp.]|jgi:uncharacterized protein (UPF0147 family)|nr:hypothetical protein [Raineya sp.]
MSWLCINCETVNFDAETRCIVCGDERYYTASEMKLLLENHPEAKQLRDENKRLNTQNKWLQTRNKNLTQENKLFKEQLTPKQEAEIPLQKEEIVDSIQESTIQSSVISNITQQKNTPWHHKVVFWQITTAIATIIAIIMTFRAL